MTQTTQSNTLYFGDNLDILRAHIADESIDWLRSSFRPLGDFGARPH